MEKLRIIVSGFIGLYPSGGVTWDYIQYVLGLKVLGHDVYYFEDTGQYSNYRTTERAWNDPFDSVAYLRNTMLAFGLENRWAYRDTFSKQCYGLSLLQVLEICSSADLLINVSDANICRDEYMYIPKKILIDSDPMFTQLQTKEKGLEDERYPVKKFNIKDYNYHYSFGENIGAADCKIPQLDIKWLPTRQPVCLNYWKAGAIETKQIPCFTTVMNWSTRTKLKFDNQEWGQKDVEFKKFISVPRQFKAAEFKIVMAASAAFKKDVDAPWISGYGWRILDPINTVSSTRLYQEFISTSDAEFSIAKETYVKSNSGWFSCRSACYLAMGRPVITQETKWSKYISAGMGLLAFNNMETAIDALREVSSNISKHSKAAREIAEEYFDSNKVLSTMLEKL